MNTVCFTRMKPLPVGGSILRTAEWEKLTAHAILVFSGPLVQAVPHQRHMVVTRSAQDLWQQAKEQAMLGKSLRLCHQAGTGATCALSGRWLRMQSSTSKWIWFQGTQRPSDAVKSETSKCFFFFFFFLVRLRRATLGGWQKKISNRTSVEAIGRGW